MSKQMTGDGFKSAPMPGGNFVKLAIGASLEGVMTSASMEIASKKDKKGKVTEKERYHFSIGLSDDTVLLIGKKKAEKEKKFLAGEIVTLPDHGFLVSVMRRTACEIANVPFEDEKDTDLTPLIGVQFIITRLEDGEITSGQFSGVLSAMYDVKYKLPVKA